MEITRPTSFFRIGTQVRRYEVRTFIHIDIHIGEHLVMIGSIILKQAIDGIVGNTITGGSAATFVIIGGTDGQLGECIREQVVHPDERVMYLRTVKVHGHVSVVERERGVDYPYTVRYGSESRSILRDRRKDRSTGIGVEERVDDERITATLVYTYRRSTIFLSYGTATVIHEYTVADGQFRQFHLL